MTLKFIKIKKIYKKGNIDRFNELMPLIDCY